MNEFYTKFFQALGSSILLFFMVSNAWSLSEADQANLVEIKLLENLDDDRGFCIDIRGHQRRASTERGLQAHSCYSYQGRVAVDQGFDANRIKQNQLFLPHFDICVSTETPGNPLNLKLVNCDEYQEFIFDTDNTIRLKDRTNLCLTVADGPSRAGGGGSPVHLIRNLSVQPCNEERSSYQNWGLRRVVNGVMSLETRSK